MMTLSKVTSGAAAASYYEGADDYYNEEGRAPSQWWGAGAAALGLDGPVEAEAFRALLDGELPDGSRLGSGGQAGERRAGTDLTFSAPKSVSLQALVGGDQRLIDAHERAVTRTLAYIEARLTGYRSKNGGEVQHRAGDNLTVARFRHDLSRAADPQLHTHAVVVNATLTTRGWRALDVTEIYRQQKFLGAHYRAELAQAVRELGYAVRPTHSDGRFELVHISDHQVQAFSRRSQAINDALAERGQDRATATSAEKEYLGLATRQRKTDLDRTALWAEWRERSAALGINYAPAAVPEPDAAVRAAGVQAAVRFAIDHQTERQSLVTHDALVGSALGRVMGHGTLADIERELAHCVTRGELLQAGEHYTTEAAQARERELLAIERSGRDALPAMVAASVLRPALADSALNIGQRTAVETLLTTGHRIVGVQGLAGSGKTTMLSELQTQATAHCWAVLGVGPSASAAQELGKAGIQGGTIAGFLARNGSGLDSRTLLVVDEAGMVPATDMLRLAQAVELAGARLALVGDTQQLHAVQAGKPFAQLQAHGMPTATMDEILRQHNATLKAAVERAARGEVRDALSALSAHIVEIAHHGPRHARIAQDYANLSAPEREQTLIVAGTQAARRAINAEVRQRLGLAGQGVTVPVLERRDLTEAEKRSSVSYGAGDLVEAQARYDSLGLARGDLAMVVDASAGRVVLQRADGEQVTWRPAQMSKVAVYSVAERELAVGDKVRLNVNNYLSGYLNGDRAQVQAIDQAHGLLTLERDDGRRLTLDMARPLQLDHGYAQTVHSAQGQTCSRVLIDADARSAMAAENLFYVAISRAQDALTIYTDDRELLPEAMSRESGKTAALELDERAEKTVALER